MSAIARLTKERKAWRRDHPLDGSLDLMSWRCAIPGARNTPWEGGEYQLFMYFKNEFPYSAPECIFQPKIFHPNVSPSGRVCFSTLGSNWKSEITVKQILLGIQQLMREPNANSPENHEAAKLYKENIFEYNKRLRTQAKEMAGMFQTDIIGL